VPGAELARAALDLVRRLETLRREDEERLEAIDAYARTAECRSMFIRRYFGETDPPPCGRCDRCAAVPPRKKRRGRRGRGRRGRSRPPAQPAAG